MVMPRKSHRQPRRPRIKATIRVNDRQDYKADRISPGRLVAWAVWEAGEATTDATSRDRVLFQARH